MKSLLLSFLVGLAVASNVIHEHAYRTQKEYLYRYESQILNGMTKNSPQHNGFKISATARMQFNTGNTVTCKFENVVLYKIQQPVVQLQAAVHTLPNELLKEWVGPEVDAIISEAEKAFTFKYQDGHVTDVRVYGDALDDLRKGFLSLFEVNLNKRLMLDGAKGVVPQGESDMYTVFESAPTGDCATLYTVQPGAPAYPMSQASQTSYVGQAGQMSVNKVRDYSRCVQQPGYFKAFDGLYLPEFYQMTANPLSRQASIDYAIRGSNDQFIIMSAMAQERIVFSPYYNPETPEEIRTSVNQTLTLIGSTGMSEVPQITVSDQLKPHELYVTLPTDLTDPQNPFTEPLTQQVPSAIYLSPEKIVAHVKMVAANTEFLTCKQSLVHMRLLTEMLRQCHYDTIKAAYNILTQGTNRFATEVFWSALPHVGTRETAHFVIDVCSQEPTMTSNCSTALTTMTLTVQPTPQLINKLIAMIAKLPRATPITEWKQKLYLTLGSFGFKMTKIMGTHMRQIATAEKMLKSLLSDNQRYIRAMVDEKLQAVQARRDSIQTAYAQMTSKILAVLEQGLENADASHQILCLKAIGNAGIPGAAALLRKVVVNPQHSMYVRIMAVCAHRRLFAGEKQAAVSTMLEVLLDSRESHDIRNMAFTILMRLNREMPVLEKIASMLHTEKDAHVTGYIVSFWQAFHNTTFSPVGLWSRNMSIALNSAPRYMTGAEQSFYKFWGNYNEETRMGLSASLKSIGSMDRYTGWSFVADTTVYGLFNKAFEVGVNSEGMSQFFSRLFGPKGLITSGKSFFDILKRSRRDANPEVFIQSIVKQLNIQPRAFNLPSGDVYFKMMGHELRYFDFTTVVRDLLTEGKLPISVDASGFHAALPVAMRQAMYLMDLKMTLPTEAGFPVSLQAQMSASLRVDGQVTARVPMGVSGVSQAHLNVGLRPKMVFGMYATMGLDWLVARPRMGFYGVIKVDAPIQKAINVNLQDKHIKIEHDMTEFAKQTKPLVETIFEPVSEYLCVNYGVQSPLISMDVRPIYAAGVRTFPISWIMPLQNLGFQVEVTGQAPVQSFYPIPTAPFLGRSVMNFYLRPLAAHPSVITVEMAWMNTTDEAPASLRPMTTKLASMIGEDVTDRAKVLVHVDASGQGVPRHVQFLATFSNSYQATTMVDVVVLRSAIPRVYDEDFAMHGCFSVNYPLKTFETEDVFSPAMQRQLLETLDYHIGHDSSKVFNQFLNMTLYGFMSDFTTMRNVPAFRMLEGMIPEHLIRVSNPENGNKYIRNWQQWWAKMQPLYEQVQEERKLLLDPFTQDCVDRINGYLQQLLQVQRELVGELQAVINARTMMHSELPVMQWVVMRQAGMVAALRDIVVRCKATQEMTSYMQQCAQNAETLSAKSTTIMTNCVNGVYHQPQPQQAYQPQQPQQTYQPQQPQQAYQPQQPQQTYQPQQPQQTYQPQQPQHASYYQLSSEVQQLHTTLRELSLAQIKEIHQLQTVINQGTPVSVAGVKNLIDLSRAAITCVDGCQKAGRLDDAKSMELVLLATVQNEFLIHLWQSYWSVQAVNVPSTSQKEQEIWCDQQLKMISYDLAPRCDMLFKSRDVKEVMAPMLKEGEHQIMFKSLNVYRSLIVDTRLFRTRLSDNRTALAAPAEAAKVFDQFIPALDNYIQILEEAMLDTQQLPHRPTAIVTASLLRTLRSLQSVCEMARQVVLPITYHQRFPWIQTLDQHITSVQSMISAMPPIFEKYTTLDAPSRPMSPVPMSYSDVLPRTVLNHVGEVIVEQTQIIKQLRKYLQEKSVTDEVMQSILLQVLETCSTHQTQLASYIDALVQGRKTRPTVVTKVLIQAITQQKQIYTLVSSAPLAWPRQLTSAHQITQNVQTLIDQLATIESQSEWSVEPRNTLPTGIHGALDIKWGNSRSMNNKFTTQMFATRSVEQVMSLYRELFGITRSQELVQAINRKLADETWEAEAYRDSLNTYNHIHLYSTFDINAFPVWVRQYIISAHEALKVNLWDNYMRLAPAPINENKLQAVIELSNTNMKWDMALATSGESNAFINVPLSPLVAAATPTRNTRPVYRQALNYFTAGYAPAVCMVNKDKVSTFDTVSYQLPQTRDSCKKLLAMDCSPEQSFAVTVAPTATGLHIVEIVTPKRVITVTPEPLSAPEVKVGAQVLPTLNKGVNTLAEDLQIVKNGLRMEITMPLTGLTVIVEGTFIKVEISQLFRNRMCGLCSNFDSQRSWEWEGPAKQAFADQRPFVQAYAFPGSCSTQTYQSYAPQTNVNEFIDYPNTKVSGYPSFYPKKECTLEESTLVRVGRKIVCFSEQPVTTCSLECEAQDQITKKIMFRCFHKSQDAFKIDLLKRLADQRVVSQSEMTGYSQGRKGKRALFERDCVMSM